VGQFGEWSPVVNSSRIAGFDFGRGLFSARKPRFPRPLVRALFLESAMKLSEVILRAIELGEMNGTLTFDQLNELLPALEPEDIEVVLSALSAKDIHIIDS
jgi:Sigma-70 factor, region 1.1